MDPTVLYYKMTSLQAFHQKNILQENGLQKKPLTKKDSPRKRFTKQAFHQKTFSKKTVYKTSFSPKNSLQENGLQNKPFTKKRSPRKQPIPDRLPECMPALAKARLYKMTGPDPSMNHKLVFRPNPLHAPCNCSLFLPCSMQLFPLFAMGLWQIPSLFSFGSNSR